MAPSVQQKIVIGITNITGKDENNSRKSWRRLHLRGIHSGNIVMYDD